MKARAGKLIGIVFIVALAWFAWAAIATVDDITPFVVKNGPHRAK